MSKMETSYLLQFKSLNPSFGFKPSFLLSQRMNLTTGLRKKKKKKGNIFTFVIFVEPCRIIKETGKAEQGT